MRLGMWAAIALVWAVAAGSSFGDMWDPPNISHPLTVKEGGACQEIDAVTTFRAVQAVAANNRQRLGAVEDRVKNLKEKQTPHSGVKVEKNQGNEPPRKEVAGMIPVNTFLAGLGVIAFIALGVLGVVYLAQIAGNRNQRRDGDAAGVNQLLTAVVGQEYDNVVVSGQGYSVSARRNSQSPRVGTDGGGEVVDRTARQEVNRAHARIDEVNARVDRAREGLQVLRTALRGHTH